MGNGMAPLNKTIYIETSGSTASLATGKVIREIGPGAVEVEIDDDVIAARVGFSCVVQPIAGDRVLAARCQDGLFLLAVLERLVPDKATLSLPSGGALLVKAREIGLVAEGQLSFDARGVEVHARKFHLVADSLTLLGRVGNWIADHLRISARTHETVADTHSVTAFDRVAVIEGTDVLHSQSVSQSIDNVAVTSAPAVVIATTEDLRLDGKRVTVG